jgi:hypothetical protein
MTAYKYIRGAQWSRGQYARRAIAEAKQPSPVIGWVIKIYYLELLRSLGGTSSPWSRLHLQSLAPTNKQARVVGYGPISICVIHKEGLCLSSSGDINRLMTMLNLIIN